MQIMQAVSTLSIPIVILIIVSFGLMRKTPVYDCFTEGVKDGLKTAVNIIPAILGLLVAVAMLRASGVLDLIAAFLRPLTSLIHLPDDLLPLALFRPVSGSGSLGILTDILNRLGADSFAGRAASIMTGSTETTFYTLAVYFGAVHVKYIRHTVWAALFADFVGIVASVIVCQLYFGY